MRNNGPTAMEDSQQVDVDDLLPGLVRVLPGFVIRASNACIRNQDVDGAVSCQRSLSCAPHAVGIANVDTFRRDGAFGFELRQDFSEQFDIAVPEGNRRARGKEPTCDGQADALCTTGHNRDPVSEVDLVHAFSLLPPYARELP